MYKEIPVLSINGSDSMASVGVQADARVITELGGHALGALTSVTVQDSQGQHAVCDLPADVVAGQVRAVMSDMHPVAVKVGLLRHASTLSAVRDVLAGHPCLVMAPGLITSAGLPLADDGVARLWERDLFPLAALLLLRVNEAEAVLGMRVRTDGDMERAARLLASTGAGAVLLRGGRLSQDRLTAYLWCGAEGRFFSSANKEGWQRHGVGGALSSAIATRMAMGDTVSQAVTTAHAYVHSRVVYAVQSTSRAMRPADIYNRFMSLVAAHYATEHSMSAYAARLAVTPRYLSMVTAQVVGRTPKQIFDTCLAQKASELMLTSHLTIQEVSQRLGFTSQSAFCQFFSRVMGQAPSAYRSSR